MRRNYFVEVISVTGNKMAIQQFSFVTYRKAKKIYNEILDTEDTGFEIKTVTIRQNDLFGCSKILDYVELHNVK